MTFNHDKTSIQAKLDICILSWTNSNRTLFTLYLCKYFFKVFMIAKQFNLPIESFEQTKLARFKVG